MLVVMVGDISVKTQSEITKEILEVISHYPNLPVMVLAPSTPSDYSTYYHDVYGASVERILFPLEVEKLYGDTYGINPERYYSDVDEVAEEIEDWLWDSECGQFWDSEHQNLKCHDWVTDGWVQTYRPIARMMAEDMPWHEYIVIDCY